ncbi:12235_t:CDS:2 [Funneliformis geosporum]|uniref:7370_t:CDS:1 n=1 Tax=Funneliformis geosporum TaxID=1117311 RepID=A0A9W4WPJ3_9GLOM|nr:7370_t:CDS:2 [Funneliformis geosporum]CAI2162435.1 12235_t:CDS:2 [Funneliformis geosporum]
MESKFISSKEIEEARLKRQEEWKKAFERINEKPPPIEEDYDPRTLYERLQEQKMKKEEAFQEMNRYSNLIHRLDEDEIEFLATVESEERVKELEKMKKDEVELENFRQAAAEADKVAISKPIAHEPAPAPVKNTLKQDSQRKILANAVKKTVKSTRSKSLPPVTIEPPSSTSDQVLSPIIIEQSSHAIKREPHDSDDEQIRENKRIKTKESNDLSTEKEIAKISKEGSSLQTFNATSKSIPHNERTFVEGKDSIETTNKSKPLNPLLSLLVYSDDSDDEDTS